MRKFKCYDEFKRAIIGENISSIDEQAMINKIYSKLEYKHKRKNFKIAIVILSLIILSSSIAIGEILNFDLFNKKGEKVFTLDKMIEDPIKKNDKFYSYLNQYDAVIKEVRKNAKPNQEYFILIAKQYEESHDVILIGQNNKYKNIEELKKVTLNKLKLPTFPEGISINDISVNFKVKFDEDYTKYYDKLYKECISSNKKYIFGTVKLTDEIDNIRLSVNYNKTNLEEKHGTNNIFIEIGKYKNCLWSNFDEKNVEKIKIGNEEAILYKRSSNNEYFIYYVDNYNNESNTYVISGFSQNVKHLAIEIIKSLQ